MSDSERREDRINLPPGVARDRRASVPDPEQLQRVKKKIGELLTDEGLVGDDQVQQALKIQESEGGKTVNIMIGLGYLDEGTFEKFMGSQPNTAAISLLNYTIDPKLFNLIPREMAIEREIIPIDQIGRSLTVGMICPLDWRTIETVSSMTGLRVSPVLCTKDELQAAINQYYDHPDREE